MRRTENIVQVKKEIMRELIPAFLSGKGYNGDDLMEDITNETQCDDGVFYIALRELLTIGAIKYARKQYFIVPLPHERLAR